MDINQILATIPHRYPFLLVDRVLELEPGKRAVGVKNVTINEHFFAGCIPGHPIMPGSLLVEHGAQVGCICILSMPENEGRLGIFGGVDRVKFRRPVYPGDQLVTEVIIQRVNKRFGKAHVVTRVDGQVVTDGIFTFFLASRTPE